MSSSTETEEEQEGEEEERGYEDLCGWRDGQPPDCFIVVTDKSKDTYSNEDLFPG